MGFQEQIYSLAYLTERKPFWFLPWITALRAKPANNSNTDLEIQKSCKSAQYCRMVKDEVPRHSSTLLPEQITEGRGRGCPACTCSPLLTSLRPELPRAGSAGRAEQESGQAAVPGLLPGTATPEHHLRSSARAPLPQLLARREIKVSGGREHTPTPATA